MNRSKENKYYCNTNESLILNMQVKKGWESDKYSFGGSIAERIEKGSELKSTSLKDYKCRMQISLLAFSIAKARGTLFRFLFYRFDI